MIRQIDLISPRYLELQKALHAEPYGEHGDKWGKTVEMLIRHHMATSVLDYGCGEGSLKRKLSGRNNTGLRVDEYDPAIPGKDAPPLFADLVVCTDVLEHVEPDRLENVLAHLRMLARKAVFLVVATVPTAKVLADGRNAHLIVRPAKWWRKRVQKAGFTLVRPPVVARQKETHEWVTVLLP